MQHDIGIERFSSASGSVDATGPASPLHNVFGTSALRPVSHKAAAFLGIPGARLLLALGEAAGLFVTSIVADVAYHAIVLHSLSLYSYSTAIGLLCALLYSGTMHMIDSTRRLRAPLSLSAVTDVAMVWGVTVLVVTFVAFTLKSTDTLSRGTMLFYVVFGFATIIMVRATVPRLIAACYRPAGLFAERSIVVGAVSSPSLPKIVGQLLSIGYAQPRCIELDTQMPVDDWHAELPSMIGQIYSVARSAGHGDICISADGFSNSQLEDIVQALRLVPRAVRVIPEPRIEQLLHLPRRNVGELYSVELQKVPMSGTQRFFKRVIDLALSIPLVVFLAPLLIAIAVVVKLDSRGPLLFRQQRLGYRGRPFTIFKFRTMTVMEDGAAVIQAARDDVRITRVGRWLRRSSLDELPQLFNVIRGNMSLVGPRPHAVAHDELFTKLVENYEVRQYVKPGISGWAQVNGLRGSTANTDDISMRVEFDLQYAKNASLWFDFKIMLLTVVEVLRSRNAY